MYSPDRWRLLQPYLDRALAIPDADRPSLVASLRADDPSIADDLESLLVEHQAVQRERFLETASPSLPDRPGLVGRTFGAYTLLSPIAEGGMGSVWLAGRADGRFARQVAVKLLHIALLDRGAERFTREGQILARLAHPNIARLIDAGVSPTGQPYLVLEHVDGAQIDRYCDERVLAVGARVRLFLDVLAAVANAHANLVVHRDVKPPNVLVTADGQVKLLDFGIAKLLEDEGSAVAATMLTREGGSALTLDYAAPEQLTGAPVSTATDVYALGVLLFVLLSGQHPGGPWPHTPAELIRAIVETEPPRLSDVVTASPIEAATLAANAAARATTPDRLRRALRGDLETIVARALKKAPEERYASVGALADDLRRHLALEPIGARRDSVGYRVTRFIRRNRAVAALAFLAFAAASAGVAATINQALVARAERDFALHELSRAESINDLNTFLLSDAAPSGKPFTVNDLLGRAVHIVGRQKADDAMRAELLIAIGRQYEIQDEDTDANRVLSEAYAISRALPNPSTRARASCALASILVGTQQAARAETLLRDGLAELPDAPRFARDRIFCLQCGSFVAREHGAAQDAITRIQAARQLLAQSPVHSELLDLRLLMDLADSYRIAGQNGRAAAAFEQAAARLSAAGRDDTATAGTLFNNWALALSSLGRPLESERIFSRAIDLSRADDTDRAVSPMLLVNHARELLSLGRLDEAAEQAERGYAKAQRAGDNVVMNQSLLLRASIDRERGDLAGAAGMLAEVEPRLRRALPPGHIAFAALMLQRSLLAQSHGDLPAALELDNRALVMTEASIKSGRQGADFLPLLLVRRSDVELRLRRLPEAEADAGRAVRLLEADTQPGTSSAVVGRAYVALGRALRADGKREEARAALLSAVRHLQRALGDDHPETLSARRLADDAS